MSKKRKAFFADRTIWDDPDAYGSTDPIDYYQLSREVSGEEERGY